MAILPFPAEYNARPLALDRLRLGCYGAQQQGGRRFSSRQRRLMRKVSLAILVMSMSSGCGTMFNLNGLGVFRGHDKEPYGGVKLCVEAGTDHMASVVHPDDTSRAWSLLIGSYFLFLDLPVTAVADTLTLPITIHAMETGRGGGSLKFITRDDSQTTEALD